jgi:hypothetical protein
LPFVLFGSLFPRLGVTNAVWSSPSASSVMKPGNPLTFRAVLLELSRQPFVHFHHGIEAKTRNR